MSIQELVNNKLNQEQLNRKDRQRSGKYSPSSLGRCYRNQYFNRLNEVITNPPEERNLRVMYCGNIFHDIVQELVLGYNPNIKKEVLIETEDFKGYADLVDIDEVVDIKTIHSQGFNYLSPETIRKEKYPNWLQVLFYAWKLGKHSGKLVFVSKDDLRIDEYREELGSYWMKELESEEEKLKYFWDNKVFPPALPRAYNGKDCFYCSWLNKCLELEGDNHPTKIKKEKKK